VNRFLSSIASCTAQSRNARRGATRPLGLRWIDANTANPGQPESADGIWPTVGGAGQWFFYGPGTDNVLASWNGL
jgi:hypothetical protein